MKWISTGSILRDSSPPNTESARDGSFASENAIGDAGRTGGENVRQEIRSIMRNSIGPWFEVFGPCPASGMQFQRDFPETGIPCDENKSVYSEKQRVYKRAIWNTRFLRALCILVSRERSDNEQDQDFIVEKKHEPKFIALPAVIVVLAMGFALQSFAAPPASDQAVTGVISGNVTTDQGEVRAFRVRAKDTLHLITYTIFTNKGKYHIYNLPPSTYEIQVREPGFDSPAPGRRTRWRGNENCGFGAKKRGPHSEQYQTRRI